MGLRMRFMLLLMLASSACTNARDLLTLDIMVDYKIQSENRMSESVARNQELCTLCEEFTSQAIYHLGENKTQAEIINTLHQACSRLHSFEKQCVLLVDYYAPLFFIEIATIHPEQFCEKVNFCKKTILIPLPKRDDACTICHHAVVEILTKLKDPDMQLEIIEMLLKVCNKVENFVQQCKRLVFEYGPLIMVNLEKFLETTDVCALIHACKASQEVVVSSELLAVA
ncbi:prosaposin-like isoform X1 [Phoenix dactylifera]|uniref:Pulmonary surfactant-associated protein B n=1 Tax=Phoenix dactylifera TaxID=42345 RepID=A0A8B9AQ66_PHODC|nr:prosaposin-like isoform X1 [Phoenix dactylifera]XP_038988917.1 prosaposin-like isoform X1 [Phoenix dactylifera]